MKVTWKNTGRMVRGELRESNKGDGGVSDKGETYRLFQLLFSLSETENIRFYLEFFENYF